MPSFPLPGSHLHSERTFVDLQAVNTIALFPKQRSKFTALRLCGWLDDVSTMLTHLELHPDWRHHSTDPISRGQRLRRWRQSASPDALATAMGRHLPGIPSFGLLNASPSVRSWAMRNERSW
jgi:hypothetical protein